MPKTKTKRSSTLHASESNASTIPKSRITSTFSRLKGKQTPQAAPTSPFDSPAPPPSAWTGFGGLWSTAPSSADAVQPPSTPSYFSTSSWLPSWSSEPQLTSAPATPPTHPVSSASGRLLTPSAWLPSILTGSSTHPDNWSSKVDKYDAQMDGLKAEVNQAKAKPKQKKTKANDPKGRVKKGSKEKGKRDEKEDEPKNEEVDSRTLAETIKGMLEGLTLTSTSAPAASVPTTVDPKLVEFLASKAAMSGGSNKTSVWAMLDKLGRAGGRSAKKNDAKKDAPGQDSKEVAAAEGKWSGGIMMYAPLIPTKDTKAEIAELADTGEWDVVNEWHYPTDPAAQVHVKAAASAAITTTTAVTETKPQKQSQPNSHAFRPSSSKISLEVTWWGYRIFLPPPVITQLSSFNLAANRRGALIAASLGWLIDQVAALSVAAPPEMRAGILMLRHAAPYVGAFVASAWEGVQEKNEGNGVVLTATWLMPIIIPASWDFEVHGEPNVETKSGGEGGSGRGKGKRQRASEGGFETEERTTRRWMSLKR